MRSKGKFARQIPLLLLWLFLSVILWEWIFTTFVLDAPREKKFCIAVDTAVTDSKGMALELEAILPESFRMVQVYSFDYALMEDSSLRNADLLILPERALEEYADWLSPVPDGLGGEDSQGILCRNGDSASASRYIDYTANEAEAGEAYYLCFGKNSLHLEEAAPMVAKYILEME